MGYRFEAIDIRTGAMLGGLQLTGVNWQRGLLASGGVTAGLVLSDITDHPEVAHQQREITTPYRTGVVVVKDDHIVCDAVWQPRKITQLGERLDLTGTRLWALFESRFIDIEQDKVFTQTDEADIVRWLIEHAMDRPGGDLNLTIDCPPTGNLRDVTYTATDDVSIASAVETLATAAFDFDLTCRFDGPNRIAMEFRLFSPQQGDVNPDLQFHPGNEADWSVAETTMENAVTVTGDGVVATVIRDELIELGWPRVESRQSANNLKTLEDVTTLAGERAQVLGLPRETFTITEAAYFGWQPGEIASIQIDRCRFYPEGHQAWRRIASTKVSVNDQGGDPSEITFADWLAAIPPSSNEAAVVKALNDHERRLRNAGI